ncbi:MAG: helix-turn-helix domain-containing protein, partial [Firmicutes bacterium]|nr:helix-turn-helix domain-containing protein [Bacillota bacterium]
PMDSESESFQNTCQEWIKAQRQASLLVLPSSVSHRQVEKAAMQALMFYNGWGEQILSLIRARSDWFSFIDAAHNILQNPMLIYDTSMKVLAYTRNDGTSDALWTETTATRTAYTNSAEESLELLKYIQKMDIYDKPFSHVGKGMSDPFYSCNIMANGKRIGMVTATEHNHTVTQGHQDLLWIFASLLSIQMQQEYANQQTAGLANRQLISDLIDGSISSIGHLNTRLAAARWIPKTYVHLLQFDSSVPYINDTQWRDGLDALSLLSLHGIGCLYPDHISYICTTDTQEFPQALMEDLKHVCERFQFRCGISDPFTSLLDAGHFCKQPSFALTLSGQILCFYSNVRFSHLKKLLSSYEAPGDLIHPAILQLQKLDHETGSEYIKTLQALFENQYSQVGASLSLGIHRTTLFYRMQKIENLTGIRFADSSEMLHLQISLLMFEDLSLSSRVKT